MHSSMSEEYLAVPPLLVSATGLESYLALLSRKLGQDLASVKETVEKSAVEVADAQDSVRKMKHFMCQQSVDEMQMLMKETDPTTVDEHFSAIFSTSGEIDDDTKERDVVVETLAISRKLLSENDQLKKALAENTSATKSFVEFQENISKQLAEMNFRMKSYQRDLHQLSLWLGTYDEKNQCTVQTFSKNGSGGNRVFFENMELHGGSEAEAEAALSRSPLLLAFRRFLMRDLVERVTHVADTQGRDVGTVVSGLKVELDDKVTSRRVMDLLESHSTNDSQAILSNLSKRLQEIETSYVRRDDFASGMRSKADSMLLPVKADSATVSQLEKRVHDRYVDLEERLAYFEAEREEFRNVVRSLVSVSQGQQPTAASLAAPPTAAVDSLLTHFSSRPSRGSRTKTHLAEILSARPDSMTEDDHPLNFDSRQQVYRVVGGNRGFASPVTLQQNAQPRSSVTSYNSAPPPTSRPVTGVPLGAAQPKPPSPPSTQREAIGLTANQMEYARFVTGELNRAHVNNLPPIPYGQVDKK